MASLNIRFLEAGLLHPPGVVGGGGGGAPAPSWSGDGGGGLLHPPGVVLPHTCVHVPVNFI